MDGLGSSHFQSLTSQSLPVWVYITVLFDRPIKRTFTFLANASKCVPNSGHQKALFLSKIAPPLKLKLWPSARSETEELSLVHLKTRNKQKPMVIGKVIMIPGIGMGGFWLSVCRVKLHNLSANPFWKIQIWCWFSCWTHTDAHHSGSFLIAGCWPKLATKICQKRTRSFENGHTKFFLTPGTKMETCHVNLWCLVAYL